MTSPPSIVQLRTTVAASAVAASTVVASAVAASAVAASTVPASTAPASTALVSTAPVSTTQASTIVLPAEAPPSAAKQSKVKPLPPEMASLTSADLDKVILAGSVDARTGEDQELVPSLILVTNEEGVQSEWTIPKLNQKQWKRFARNLGVRKYTEMSTPQLMRAIAALITTGDLYSRSNIVNPRESKWILTANTPTGHQCCFPSDALPHVLVYERC